MPGKSRHGKGKHPVRSKRKRSGRDSLAIAAQQTPVSQTYKAVPQPEVSAPSPSAPPQILHYILPPTLGDFKQLLHIA